MTKRILSAVVCAFVILSSAATLSFGQDRKARPAFTVSPGGAQATVRFGSDIRIPEGTTVKGDVVCFLGDIQLDGTVDGDVVSMFGRFTSGRNASVNGDLVLFMSDQASAKELRPAGALVEFNLPGKKLIMKVVGFWFKSLPVNIIIGLVGLILLVWLFVRFVIRAIDLPAMTRNLSANAGLAFLYGLLAIIALKITEAALALTIILSGVAFAIFCGFVVLWLVGYIPVALWLGEKVSVLFRTKFSGAAHFLAGILSLALISFIPVLGGLTVLVLGVIGFGLLLAQVLKIRLTTGK
jgi:hypothetical protein